MSEQHEPPSADPPGEERAAESRPETHRAGRASAWALLRESLRQPSRGQLVVALLVGLLGFAMVVQVRSRGADDAYDGLRSAELVQVLNGLAVEGRRASQEINRLEDTRDELRDAGRQRAAAIEQAREESVQLAILAGTRPAQGPGIRIDIDDPDGELTLTNLLDGIEELRDAGAEVIEVNGRVRVVAQTYFENHPDSGLLIDGQRVRPPYSIAVIGDPDSMARSMTFPGGFVADVTKEGARVEVTKEELVRVRSVVPLTNPQYAEPSAGQ